MSGLSAKTNSCGGEGSRFGLGGEGGARAAFDAFFLAGAFEKNLRIPSFFFSWRSSSISEGTEDSSDESSALMLFVVVAVGGLFLWSGS